ncbi:MAG: hypothetical protein UX20_C0017G0005 [Candidatus Magasanikbacteria bacterium GW2011_GWC2_45_8]|uniref:Uncharacterized protein n=1 Tax=Candidatus Magasanikbacteria bacterium GW2011_GWC2_45_8 TaxID=1619050 RepID=A0A0G1MZR7_9BACT|nr:MAG: hypothetical protein UX20_C0017G0005 [Candidatus Magasanikbacteria bacterium GW2011_GWC2_45_8]
MGVSAPIGGVLQGSGSVNATPTSALTENANAFAGDGVTVQVKKEGDKLTLNIMPSNSAVSGQGVSANAAATKEFTTVISKSSGDSASSTIIDRAKNTLETAVEKIKNVGDTARNVRETTVRTIHSVREVAEQGRVRVKAIGQSVRGINRNKIAVAWGGFLAFIALAGVLSYARWRRYR